MYKLRLGNTVKFCSDSFYMELESAKRLGFDTIDFNIAGAWYNEEIEESYYSRLDEGMAAVLNTGIPVNGIHLSFGTRWDPSSLVGDVRLSAVEKIKKMFRKTEILNPYCYILHPSFEPVIDTERGERIEALKKSIRTLAPCTDKIIALETIPRSCLMNTSAEAKEIIDSIALPNVKICVDVNHFLYEKSEDAVLTLGDRIATTHISDHDYVNERHKMPGEGLIDWMKLLSAFESIGYSGVFNYEAEGGFEDVKANYGMLFGKYNKE